MQCIVANTCKYINFFNSKEYEWIYSIIRSKYKSLGVWVHNRASRMKKMRENVLSQKIINNSVWYTSSNIARSRRVPSVHGYVRVGCRILPRRQIRAYRSFWMHWQLHSRAYSMKLHIRSLLLFQYLICSPQIILKCLFLYAFFYNVFRLLGLLDFIIVCHCFVSV